MSATQPASGHNTLLLQSRSRSPFFWLRPSDQSVEDIINTTQTALATSKDFLELAPVPGIYAAIGTVVTILEQIQKTKANKKTVKAFCDRTLELKATLERFNARLEDKMNNAGEGLQADHKVKAEWSKDLKERIGKLVEDVEKACAPVAEIGRQSGFRGFLSAARDEDALKDAEAGIVRSMTDFQMVGGITIEMLVDNLVNTVQDIRREQEAAARRELVRQIQENQQRQMEEDAKTLKELLPLNMELAQATNRPQSAYVTGTRTEVFEKLNTWRNGDESIFYLSGQLGRGKSVIALEFCERYKADVAASFFFKRGTGAGSSVHRLIPVVAYQLAEACSELRPHIVKAAREYVQGQKSLKIENLVQLLLSTPLSTAEQSIDPDTRLYVVVDAVDECTDSDSLSSKFLALFLPCICAHRFLRLLVTSRPSPTYIHDGIHEHPKSVCTTLSLDTEVDQRQVAHDISVTVCDILSTSPTSRRWYRKHTDVVGTILKNAEGLFVYGCTAARFMSNVEEWSVDASMKALLSKEKPYGLGDLETLYANVIYTAFPTETTIPETVKTIRTILECLVLGNGDFDPDDLERLLAIPRNQSVSILQRLRSVVRFDPPDEYKSFTPIHVTFGDFLLRRTSQSLTGTHFPYYIDPAMFHARLAVACMSDIHTHGDHGTTHALWDWFHHFLKAAKAQESGTISKSDPNETADFPKELLGLLETIVYSMNTDQPSKFFCWCRWGLPQDNPDEIATFLRWIDQRTSQDVARIFAEWISMLLRQYDIQMNDTIVVTMRGDTREDVENMAALETQLEVRMNELWHSPGEESVA